MTDLRLDLEKAAFPRPDFIRKDWMSLNGEWEFAFPDELDGPFPETYLLRPLPQKIMVPFCFQSEASGIGAAHYYERVYYIRTFTMTEEQQDKEVLLKFGAVDYHCRIWINGMAAGSHTGGHTQFELPISRYLHPGENRVYLMAEDNRDCDRPRGKQYWKDRADRCWYTATTGIWKSVWLEFTAKTYIHHVRLTPDIDRRCLELEVFLNENAPGRLDVQIHYENQVKKEVAYVFESSHYLREIITLAEEDSIDEIHYWTPDSPKLYDLSLTLTAPDSDSVACYFGMRKIESQNGQILLNNKPLYQRLVLDQGYWKESLMTPPSRDALKKDIEFTKMLGFNGARKHQKTEDPHYYYYADILGLLVWCEMPSGYQFNDLEITRVISEWQEILSESYNHPCIITWVTLNESWGVRNVLSDDRQQSFASALYYLTRSYDPTRLVSTNDGWEVPDHTDLFCIHDYEASPEILHKRYEDFAAFLQAGMPNRQALAKNAAYHGQPFIISEYGGTALGSRLAEDAWGYHDAALSEEAYLDRISSLTAAIEALPDCCGYCYTQLTDVMQEVNGLLTDDRTPKASISGLAEIFAHRSR